VSSPSSGASEPASKPPSELTSGVSSPSSLTRIFLKRFSKALS